MTGVNAREDFGQGQEWQLSYSALDRTMVEAFYSALCRNLQPLRAFTMLRERADPTSGEWMEPDDMPPVVNIAQAARDYSTVQWGLKEKL